MTQQTMVREDNSVAVGTELRNEHANVPSALHVPDNEPLLREALGATMKEFRSQSGFTLRELAKMANISPGYLSELERGRKEVSSELLASVCHAMGVSVASVILEAADMMALDAAAAQLAASMNSQPAVPEAARN